MQYAQVVIIEAGSKEIRLNLKEVRTINEIYDIFYSLTGYRCVVSMSAGVARVNCNTPQLRKEDNDATGS